MKWLPRSLFARLACVLFGVLLLAQGATWFLFRQDRAALLDRQFSATKLEQLQALQGTLAASKPGERPGQLRVLGNLYGVRIIPFERRPEFARAPIAPRMQDLAERLRERLGPETEARMTLLGGEPHIVIRLQAGEQAFWVGFPARAPEPDLPWRLVAYTLVILVALMLAAFVFARKMAQPLKDLTQAAKRLGEGEAVEPLNEAGPSEIAAVAKGFNTMSANLARMEQDREMMLAGVSHDVRTPLTRLRLELEMSGLAPATRHAMQADLEEIDRTVGQFLDFARVGHETVRAPVELDALLEEQVQRELARGRKVVLETQPTALLDGHRDALQRAVANLIDNAFRYGSAVVEIRLFAEPGRSVIEIADRGPGIDAAAVERLKRPFVRGDAARSGASGAGLGLAIVQRIVLQHGGDFAFGPRIGGGAVARLSFPSG